MIQYDVDVLVIGGGPAGFAAGVSAARRGLRTLLIENLTSLGGLMTNGFVTGPAGIIEGICKELLDRLDKKGYLYNTPHTPAVDPERCKFEMETMLLQSGCRLLYGMHAVDVVMNGNNIESVVCYSKSGRTEIKARYFIDATGDADIAAAAGVPYEVGNAEYMGLNLAHTMGVRMSNVNMKKFREAMKAWQEDNTGYPKYLSLVNQLMDEAVKNGDLPYPIFPGGLIYQVPGTPDEDADITFNVAHSYYNHNTCVEDLSRQIVEQHQQNQWLEAAYRKYVPGFERARITALASLPGIRDSRRIVGEYVMKDTDIAAATKFEDAIAKFPELYDTHHPTNGYWGFRHHIHSKEPIPGAINITEPCDKGMHPFCPPEEGSYSVYQNPATYCEVPYRVIVPLKVDNLFVVGRCVSAQFHAMAAVRIITICMATGQAAGIAADLCLQKGVTPRQLDGRLVREEMIKAGVPLDKAPDGYWAFLAELAKDDINKYEFVRLRGDFVGVRLPNGKITIRFGNIKKEDTEDKKE
ncbi:MAG: FAD-dependent oxidoreductase [Clostridiales bacterium]|nr:FAD-dependent oxidoreductase [Clostridiales bacterium]